MRDAQFWLPGVLCYRGYKPAREQQAPLRGGALKAGLQAAERKKEGPGSCSIQMFWQSPVTFGLGIEAVKRVEGEEG